MGCSASLPLGNFINERATSNLSSPPTNINGPVSEECSSLLPLREPVDVERSSNLTTRPAATEKKYNEVYVEDELGWLDDEENVIKELNNDEIMKRKDSLFRQLNKAIKHIHENLTSLNENENCKEDLYLHFRSISFFPQKIQKIGKLPLHRVNTIRSEAGKQLSETKSVVVIGKVVTNGWQNCNKKVGSMAVEPPSKLMLEALFTLWNFSDMSHDVKSDIVGDSNFLKTLNEILTAYRDECIQGEGVSPGEKELVGGSLSIICNISTVDENITPLRSHGFVAIVSPYLDSTIGLDRWKALACLANLIDEKESEILQDKGELLEFFLDALKIALQSPKRRCDIDGESFSAWECALTINRLARNHANKKLLVTKGCLLPLVELAKIGTDEEKREAVGAIWLLAFDKDNQNEILKKKELNIIEVLFDIKEKSNDVVSKERADGTLWLLREELQKNEKYKDKVRSYSNWNNDPASVKQGSSIGATESKDRKGHIMISYNRSHREVLIKIKDKLENAKYTVWMDIYDMEGYVTQAMANAVELAHVVLISMSQKYTDSDDCMHEANYAYQLRKNIVPLKMEADYNPNGWLGLIVAGKKNYDFSGKYKFETKLNELLKELSSMFQMEASGSKDVPYRQSYLDNGNAVPKSIATRSVAHPGHQTSSADFGQWNQKNVNDWLDKYSLPKEQFGRLTGKDLATLAIMKSEAAEYFFRYLEKKLKIESLSIMGAFIHALEHV